MLNIRHSARLAAVVAAGALILASCGGGGGGNGDGDTPGASNVAFDRSTTTIINPSDAKGGTLQLGSASDCDSWDPARAYYGFCWNLQRLYARTLMSFAPDPKQAATVVPDLATGPGETSDFQNWTYTLREGVTYENGTAITSADIKYALERNFALDVISGGPNQYFLPLLDDGANKTGTPDYQGPYKDKTGEPMVDGKPSIETPDDQTIVFHLTKPYSDFDYLMAMGPSSPVPKAADDGENYTQHPVSSGPYKIDSYDPDGGISFVRNTKWDQATDDVRTPKASKIDITYISNSDDLDQRLKTGTLDARVDGSVGPTLTTEAFADPNLKKLTDNPIDGSLEYINVFQQTAPFDNVHCRRAVFYAVNKKSYLLASGGANRGEIVGSLTPAGLPGSDPEANMYPNGADFTGDLDKAKDELAKCGQPDGFSTNYAYTNVGTGQAEAAAVQEALARVGIKVELKAGEPDTYFSQFIGTADSVEKNKLGLGRAGWGADYPTTNGFWFAIAHGKANNPAGSDSNYVDLKDPKVDALLDEALEAPEDEWDQIARDLDDQLMKDAVYVPVYWGKSVYWRAEQLTNVYSTNFFGLYDWVNIGVSGDS